MSTHSRLPLDPSTHLPSIHTFGQLSEFLRGAVADEDSRIFSESMGQLASHVEAIVAGLRLDRRRDSMAPLLMDLMTVLRDHRNLVLGLGLAWRELYEYAAYLQALNNFRVLIGQWLLQGGTRQKDLAITADDFGLVAWRTLAEGMLLIDMYEQAVRFDSREGPSTLGPTSTEPQLQRAVQWWQKLRL
jgi:hypothetical protein